MRLSENVRVGMTLCAAILLAVAIATFTTQAPINYFDARDDCVETRQQQSRTNDAVAIKENAPADVSAQRHEAREEEDLCAQRQMAESAKEQAAYSLLGVLLLFLTLVSTAWAARAASEAAKQAARSVDVQVRIEQPLLLIGPLRTDMDQAEITYSVENLGKTPAVLIQRSVYYEALDDLPAEPRYDRVITIRDMILRPDSEPLKLTVLGKDGTAPAVMIDHATAYFWGYFRYEDVFGRTRKMGFCYRCDPMSDDPGGLAYHILWSRAGGKAYNYDREEGT